MKQRIKNKILKYLFNTVTVEDILISKRGELIVDGNKLTEQEVSQLKAEAHYLKQSRLYSILSAIVVNKARRTMFERSLTFDDMLSGKMLLMADDLQKTIIDKLTEEK